nr:hypothetical protein [Candidatus Delongbacteria bacterium]
MTGIISKAKFNFNIWLFLLVFIIPAQLFASIEIKGPGQSFNSVSDGIWKDASSWDLTDFPDYNTTDNKAEIYIQHKITLNDDLDVKGGTYIEISDTLVINGNVNFDNGSQVQITGDGVLIVNGIVDNEINSTLIKVDGNLIIYGDYYGGNGSTLSGTGAMLVSGSVTTDGSGSVFGSTVDCVPADAWDCKSSSGAPLPVDFLYLDASVKGGAVSLNWATASEINNDHFIIERSTDLKVFDEIAIIDGKGNSSTGNEYSWEDISPAPGINYYRLTQVDYDGTTTMLSMVQVTYAIDEIPEKIECFPNPFVSDLYVHSGSFTGNV